MFRKRIQLGLIHMAVAMTLVPINSTLNRVMIKELAISATLVALMASFPYLLSPIQVFIGSFADRHAIWGFRRTPYILLGLLFCTFGVVASPYVALLIAKNFWVGLALGLLSFGAWGMGYNLSAVSYLSLATEISGEKGRSRTIAVMFSMMILGIIFTAIAISRLVVPYTPLALMRAFSAVGVSALVLGILGLVYLENRSAQKQHSPSENYTWKEMLHLVTGNPQAKHFFLYLIILLSAILGQDILLEPFAAEAFGMPVDVTTRITSIWGICFLAAMLITGGLEGKLLKRTLARIGGWVTFIGFGLIACSGVLASSGVFYAGLVILGVGSGIATVSNLSLMLDMTTSSIVGLYMGVWGMANAISRLLGSLISGAVRDALNFFLQNPVLAYVAVFSGMAVLMLISLWMLTRIDVRLFNEQAEQQVSVLERAAQVN
jgi:BCD family chlorophyll transporter-like MFS transporter